MIQEKFIENILAGVRQWAVEKLERISFVVSNHIIELADNITSLQTQIKNIGFVIARHVNELNIKIEKDNTQLKNTEYVVANHINNLTTRIEQDEERMNDMDEVVSAVLIDHENRIPHHIVKQIHVDTLKGYIDNGHVALTEYGLSTDDVQMFIDGKLTINVVVDLITTALSFISPELYNGMPKAMRSLIGKVYQTRFSTSENTTATEAIRICDILLILQSQQVEQSGYSIYSYGFQGFRNVLIAIKYSILGLFEQPKIILRLQANAKEELGKKTYGSEPDYNAPGYVTTPDIVVTDNKILFLGAYPLVDLDYIANNIDSMLELSEGTFYQMTTAQVIYECYNEILSVPQQAIVDQWKTNIEAMVTWNGYNNIYEFVSVLNYLETEQHDAVNVTIDGNSVQVDTDSTYYEQRDNHQEYDTDLYYAPYYKEGETAEMYSVINAFPTEFTTSDGNIYVDEYYTTCVPESEYIS